MVVMSRLESEISDACSEIRNLKSGIERILSRTESHTWMRGFILAGTLALIIKTIFP
jgi:hypothetical protein